MEQKRYQNADASGMGRNRVRMPVQPPVGNGVRLPAAPLPGETSSGAGSAPAVEALARLLSDMPPAGSRQQAAVSEAMAPMELLSGYMGGIPEGPLPHGGIGDRTLADYGEMAVRSLMQGVGDLGETGLALIALENMRVNPARLADAVERVRRSGNAVGFWPGYVRNYGALGADRLGLTHPETAAEKAFSAVGEAAGGTAATWGLGGLLKTLRIAPALGSLLMEQPLARFASNAGSNLAGEWAREADATPWEELAARTMGGMGPSLFASLSGLARTSRRSGIQTPRGATSFFGADRNAKAAARQAAFQEALDAVLARHWRETGANAAGAAWGMALPSRGSTRESPRPGLMTPPKHTYREAVAKRRPGY